MLLTLITVTLANTLLTVVIRLSKISNTNMPNFKASPSSNALAIFAELLFNENTDETVTLAYIDKNKIELKHLEQTNPIICYVL